MVVEAGALMLDFFAAPVPHPASDTANGACWDITARQRSAPPHAWDHMVFTTVTPGQPVAPATGAGLSAGPFLPRHPWDGSADEQRTKFALVALTNAREGMEEEYDRWYWDRHFPDGRRLPGCFAGRRYQLAPGGHGSYQHLALYLFDGDIDKTLDVLAKILGTPDMPGSPAISPVFEDWYVQPRR